MVSASPYLPDLLRGVVSEVNEVFANRDEDAFNVFFSHGLQENVTKSIYKKENASYEEANIYPLIWLVTGTIDIKRGGVVNSYGIATFDMIIAMPTSNEFTQDERDDTTIKPRLLPIYDELIYQLSISNDFRIQSENAADHHYRLRPYWGGLSGI